MEILLGALADGIRVGVDPTFVATSKSASRESTGRALPVAKGLPSNRMVVHGITLG